jgi:hypothetical protein
MYKAEITNSLQAYYNSGQAPSLTPIEAIVAEKAEKI